MAEANAYLPEDTLIIILSMLPVKSLMRFRSVCKLWYQIISSASFIDAQRKTTKDQYLLCTHTDFCALIRKEEFTNYRTYYSKPLHELSQEFINYKLYHYTLPKLLYGTPWCDYTVKVYGSCNGLLCLTDKYLRSYVDIILLNPVIRKAKTIPKIPVELRQDYFGGAALCLGYFDDDYKVIRISFRCRICWVGVYSLRTGCWKITNCGKYDTFKFNAVLPICVGGVAYFVADQRIVCFNLTDEKIVQIPVPETFITNWLTCCTISLEACRESIALMQLEKGCLQKWVLQRYGHASNNNSYTWKNTMTISTCMQFQHHKYVPIESSGVGAYVLRDYSYRRDLLCVCGNPEIISEVKGFENNNLTNDLVAINVHMGNLVLLNEQTLDPLLNQETETCSTRSMLIFYLSV